MKDRSHARDLCDTVGIGGEEGMRMRQTGGQPQHGRNMAEVGGVEICKPAVLAWQPSGRETSPISERFTSIFHFPPCLNKVAQDGCSWFYQHPGTALRSTESGSGGPLSSPKGVFCLTCGCSQADALSLTPKLELLGVEDQGQKQKL